MTDRVSLLEGDHCIYTEIRLQVPTVSSAQVYVDCMCIVQYQFTVSYSATHGVFLTSVHTVALTLE